MKKFLFLISLLSLLLISCGKRIKLENDFGLSEAIGKVLFSPFIKSEVGDTINVNKDINLITKEDCFLVEVK